MFPLTIQTLCRYVSLNPLTLYRWPVSAWVLDIEVLLEHNRWSQSVNMGWSISITHSQAHYWKSLFNQCYLWGLDALWVRSRPLADWFRNHKQFRGLSHATSSVCWWALPNESVPQKHPRSQLCVLRIYCPLFCRWIHPLARSFKTLAQRHHVQLQALVPKVLPFLLLFPRTLRPPTSMHMDA